jgi:magnesium transporter
MLMRVTLYDKQTGNLQTGGAELLEGWEKNPQQLLWLDLDGSRPEQEKNILQHQFGIHPLAISDAQRERHPPKIEVFHDCTFILLKGLNGDLENIEYSTLQLALFCNDDFLITRHSADSPSTNRLWSQYQDNPTLFAAGTGPIAIGISRAVVDRYTNLIIRLEPRLELLEDEMFENPNDDILAELIGYKGQLKKLRRIFTYHKSLFEILQQMSTPGIPDELTHNINDVYEHQERVSSLAQLYYELASDLIDGYISLASHRLNQIMKLLTIITAIFVPITFIAGIYGMNFEYIPELQYQHGYFIAIGTMVSIVAVLMFVFKYKKWI